MTEVQIIPLKSSDRESFIKDNQEAFNYGALEEYGLRDVHFEDKNDEQIISRKNIEACIDTGEQTCQKLRFGCLQNRVEWGKRLSE